MLADTAQLIVRLSLKDEMSGAINKAGSGLSSLGSKMTQAGSTLTKGLTLPILGAAGAAVKLAMDAEETDAKLSAAFTSMGADSWTSLERLRGKAEELMSKTTFDDEAIKSSQAVLLTFGNVTGEAFDKGTMAALDMSTALNMDLQSATVMIGKALNDPVKGITAMTKAGIQFTDEQKSMIARMVEMGDTAGAQTIILGELERQFGGMAETVAGTSGGKMKQALNQLAEVGEELGAMLLPFITEAAKQLKNLATAFQNLSPEVKNAIVVVGGLAAALGPVLLIGGKIVGMLSGAAGLIAKIIAMTTATAADTTATTANTTAKNLNAKALLGVGAAAGAVVGGLILVNEGLNESNRQGEEAVGILEDLSSTERQAAADTEVFGMRVGNITDGFATFTETLFGWHSVADTAADVTNTLNGRIETMVAMTGNLGRGLNQAAADMLTASTAFGDAADSAAIDHATNNEIQDSWQRMGLDVVNQIATARSQVLANARQMTDDLAGTVRGSKDKVRSAMDEVIFAINHPMKMQRELARIEGALTGERLAEGLRSKNPYVRGVAEQQQAQLVALWESMTGTAYNKGVSAGTRYGGGLSSQTDEIASAARIIRDRILAILPDTVNIGVRLRTANKVSRLPTFHSGGVLPAGGLGISGEAGAEWAEALPGGGVRFTPMGGGNKWHPGGRRSGGGSVVNVHLAVTARDIEGVSRHRRVIQGNRAFA